MKKAVLVLILASMGITLFAQTGMIRELSGTVELKNAGQSSFTAAKVGDRVNQDTVISTSLKSSALIEVGSAVITVRPLTRLTLTEIQASDGEEMLNVNLQAGRVRVDLNPPAGAKASMSVSSPNATASVRGTSFYFDTRNLQVEQGTVLFKGSRGYTVQAAAGSSSMVTANRTASAPQFSGRTASSSPVVGYDPSSRDTGGAAVTLPVSPGSPAAPGGPDTPAVPGNPSAPYYPIRPGIPGLPGIPGIPGEPNNPTTPSIPSEPSNPTTPSNPSNPTTPSEPSTPGNPSGVDIGVDYQ